MPKHTVSERRKNASMQVRKEIKSGKSQKQTMAMSKSRKSTGRKK